MIRASIVGATGYTGALLTDILSEHPDVQLDVLTSRSYAGRSVCDVFPHLRIEGRYAPYSIQAVAQSDVAFVCYPHAEAHAAVAALVDAGCKVVDLSADFRLKDPEAYTTWYGFTHPRRDLVAEAVYGLPEVYREKIAGARLVANPGCYPTGMLLGLLPVAGRIDGSGVIVDSKSGVSGAGRTPSDKTHFCAVTGNFRAYSEVGHRHTAEMLQELGLAAGQGLPVAFTPHLLPVERGILSTLYFRPVGGFVGTDKWLELYRAFYQGEPFVEVCDHVPGLSDVAHTNFCRVTVREDKAAGVVKIFTVIDNLVKGASGQAVQNMNCMFGLREDAGLGRAV
ncbi:MAG: N-acetyl-gamma-glutamyl-phosphate reductase [Actinobacteria bacterium RBG_16_64_13]|nr:MAG: N-acetyl-gamma-glutamyl-phosphate reductase [Actinobacteria bacterium RBG_16_64_13]